MESGSPSYSKSSLGKFLSFPLIVIAIADRESNLPLRQTSRGLQSLVDLLFFLSISLFHALDLLFYVKAKRELTNERRRREERTRTGSSFTSLLIIIGYPRSYLRRMTSVHLTY